ncbi:MAG: trimethylamine methyltransferase family protein, partial [Hyphomicrobiales bacterium]|nr:trimethylamine methyltransferase family protein [Hyphomicrobiales bacterium]
QTLSLMQTEYVYPSLGDRTSPKEWAERDKPDMVARAVAEKRRLLDSFFPRHISEETDAAIRARLDIKLPLEAMRRG